MWTLKHKPTQNYKQTQNVTVLARCLNMFSKTWLSVSNLYTQEKKTEHWEINHSHLCQIETTIQT